MSMRSVDFDEVLAFCQEFKTGFLEPTSTVADSMIGLSNDINSSLRGTQFATKSQQQVEEMAKRIKNAVDTGTERILVLERRIRQLKDRAEEFTR